MNANGKADRREAGRVSDMTPPQITFPSRTRTSSISALALYVLLPDSSDPAGIGFSRRGS